MSKSYGRIVKSSSVTGGSAGLTFLLGLARAKFAALLMGTSGVGLVASLSAILTLIGTLAGGGVQASAVREIAAASSRGDGRKIGQIVLLVNRLAWVMGLLGMLGVFVAAPAISLMTFNSKSFASDITALGLAVLLMNLAGAKLALLQGTRQIGDLARVNVYSAILGTLTAAACFYALGLRGVAPSLVALAAFQYAFAWHFARRIEVQTPHLRWTQSLTKAGPLYKLGFVFMLSALMVSGVNNLTIYAITRELGLGAVGLYSAAFLLSGMSVNFVLGAMGTDYYPRLTAVAGDNESLNCLVNEQTEIGLLLTLPVLLIVLTIAPWILELFYAKEFSKASSLLQWFTLGCLGRLVSWPLSFVILALGKGRWYLSAEIIANTLHIIFIFIGLKYLKLEGVAVAFFVLYGVYTIIVYLICRRLTNFSWSPRCVRIFKYALPLSLIVFLACRSLPITVSGFVGAAAAIFFGRFCLRELVMLLDAEHKFVRLIALIPGVKYPLKDR